MIYRTEVAPTVDIGEILTSAVVVMKPFPQAHTPQFCNKYNKNMSFMWADRYMKNTMQLKFRNSVSLARVLAEIFSIRVNTNYCVIELINEYPFPKLGGTCRIFKSVC
jgi:plasmid maintenance system killer protein